ncbi:TPA: cupin fold metalloprotein, WbuC family, partial [Klebsiella pneumoniae]|nr:cupin fold metalloprotein, WbuC family [Escherichia coli]HBS1175077.1 cupin fold metalloprotein, WbuC family [Klebsiella pneumoniae]HBT3128373.1 cupin fold metalloprotein, WbuC family [Klebsiella aerogenes]HBY0997607.1 cupin fold metalloprotein, WbuC family [Klebsiella pneumoniae]
LGCHFALSRNRPLKHGGYQPVAADDYAHWAPAEGEPGTTELMAWYAQAQVGDSTFAV